MDTEEYTFTGFMPSGNPFVWYYDEHRKTAFTTSLDVGTWDARPEIGDKIKIVRNATHEDQEVYINGKRVYTKSAAKDKQRQVTSDTLYADLAKSKGLKL